jgi:hypothetical protein
MATFTAQVVDLVGTFSDETALDTFITEGANEVINAMPRSMQERVAEETAVSTGTTTSEGHKVLYMLRSDSTIDQPCRRIPASRRGRAADSDDMEYATTSDPAYYVKDGKFNILPSGAGLLVSMPTYSQTSPLDASAISTITNFPNEAEYLVTLYAAIKALQQNMTAKYANASITTALGLIKTQVDSQVTALSNMATEIALANQEVDDALTEIAEAISLTDSAGSGIQLAVDKMASANLNFRADGGDPALFGDESTYHTSNSAMTNVKTYVDRAISYINGDFPAATHDLLLNLSDVDAAITNEDIELANARMQQAQTTMTAVQTDLNIAQMYITEWNTLAQTLIAEVNSFASEASARYGWVNSKAVVWNGELAAAQGYMNTAGGYANQASGFSVASQGYASEVQTRLAVDTTEYIWYEKQQTKLQADYDKGIQLLKAG